MPPKAKSDDWQVFPRQRPGQATRYVLSFKTGAGWKQKTAPPEIRNERDANAWAEGYVATKRASGALAPRAKHLGPTVAEKRDAWIALRRARPRLRKSTVDDNLSHFRTHIEPALGARPLASLAVADVRAFVRQLRDTRVQIKRALKEGETPPERPVIAPLTVRNVLNTLAAFLADAHAEGWVVMPVNPARDGAVTLELPKLERRSGRRVLYLQEAAVQTLLDHPEVPLERKVLYAVAACVGLRDGELHGLRASSVFLDHAVPHLSVTEAAAIRGPKGHASASALKTEASERKPPLNACAQAALRWWMTEGYALVHGGTDPSGHTSLFPGRVREFRRPKSAALLRKDLKAVGLPTHDQGHPYTFQALRHSCATWLDAAGVDEPTVQAILGHEGRSVTRRSYTAPVLARLAKATDLIGLVWRPVVLPEISKRPAFAGALPAKNAAPLDSSAPLPTSERTAEKKGECA